MESSNLRNSQSISAATAQVFDQSVRPQTMPPEDGRNGLFIKNFGKFEREGSTFHWKIFRPGREKLLGYSKPKDMAEKANKQELVMDVVRRLSKNYLKEGMRIEVYRAYDPTDDNQSVKLFTLHATRFIPEPVILSELWLIGFLKNIYSPPISYYDPGASLFPTGEAATPPAGAAVIPDPAQQPTRRGAFDLERSFKSIETLLAYCNKLTSDGYAQGQVSEFYRVKSQAFKPNS